MRRRVVAVEDGLSTVEGSLRARGYEVVRLHPDNLHSVDAVFVSGMDENFLGQLETSTRGKVVDAAGMNPQEVQGKLDSFFREMS